MEQQPETPFGLKTDHGMVVCQDVLRFLPGKRLVVRAELDDQQVIVKCFYGNNADRYYQRELTGIQGFIHAGIDTPALLGHNREQQSLHTIVTEDLGKVESLEKVWKKTTLDDNQRRCWLHKAAILLARLHHAGVCQDDIHLDNLLVCNDRLYMIDGGGATVSTTPLSEKQARHNLALFMAVFFPRYDRFVDDVLSAYAAENTAAIHWEKTDFLKTVLQLRKWRERFIQKSLRNCTHFRVESSQRHFAAFSRQYDDAALQALIANPEAFIADGKILKLGRTNTVAIVTLDNERKVLIKKYQSTKGLLHKYLRTLRSSRARKAWLNGHLLQFLGIDTPTPMAMLEHRAGPAITCSYIITDFVPSTHAMAYFDPSQDALPEWPQVSSDIGDILITLKRSCVYHGDLKGNNFLIRNNKPLLIDLDAMTSYKWRFCFQRLFRKDLERFSRNWKDNPRADALFRPVIEAWEQAS
ncbi:lipopolysaccharide kinase InaA family protein [Kistimonas asteriae]|uniref:lipopolysaccharide kinase InaA family protein n=1 Tax=Kistimonas asteriae TaxID=517724 RepID=UPI001BAB854F|nr:lipopolysaccharide kinase InaA family protein [Kistimonas asteriae]